MRERFSLHVAVFMWARVLKTRGHSDSDGFFVSSERDCSADFLTPHVTLARRESIREREREKESVREREREREKERVRVRVREREREWETVGESERDSERK